MLYGFDNPCLVNPKQCAAGFVISLSIILKPYSSEGFILTTSNYNKSAVGTSLFVEDGQLVTIIQTETRVWNVSGPVPPVLNCSVRITWSYEEEVTMKIGNSRYNNMYVIRDHFVESTHNSSLVIGGRHLDFVMSDFMIEIPDVNNADIAVQLLSGKLTDRQIRNKFTLFFNQYLVLCLPQSRNFSIILLLF